MCEGQVDPEAAQIVFNSGATVTMVPLQVTHTAIATEAVLGRIRAGPESGAAFLRVIVDMLTFFASTYRTTFGFSDPPVHDPCAVAYALRPELFKVCMTSTSFDKHAATGHAATQILEQVLLGMLHGCMLCIVH